MRVLLIDPPQKVGWLVAVTAVNQGLAAIAAALRARGHDVRVADFLSMRGGWSDLERLLGAWHPDAVGISCAHAPFFHAALQCAALVRHVAPGAIVVGGGSQFEAMAREALSTGNVDWVIRGEGDEALPELLESAQPETVAGVVGPAGAGPPRPLLRDLDALPSPAWDLFPVRQHGITALGGRRSMVLTTSRGCLNRCAFCSEGGFWRGSWAGWSGERAAEELRRVHTDYRKDVFYLGDNDFLADPARVEDFCRALARRPLQAWLWVQTTCRHAVKHRGLLKALRSAGAYQVMLGLESVSPAVLKRYRKPQDVALMEQAIGAVKDAGLAVMGCWMWGDWEDDEESLRAGVDWVLDRCDFLAPSIAMPYPGTAYHEQCLADGRIEERNLEKYGKFHFVMPTRTLDRERCQQLFDDVVFGRRWMLHNLRTWACSPHPPARWYARTLLLTELLYTLNARLSRRPSFERWCRETRGSVLPWRPPSFA